MADKIRSATVPLSFALLGLPSFAFKYLSPPDSPARLDSPGLRRTNVNRLEGTLLATGRRGNVNRLQRPHTLGLAGARQRPELDRPQRAVTFHRHHTHLSSIFYRQRNANRPLSLFRKINTRFLTKFFTTIPFTSTSPTFCIML